MCKHKLRTMDKQAAIRIITYVELVYWIVVGSVVFIVYFFRSQDKRQTFVHYVNAIGYSTREQRKKVDIAVEDDEHQFEHALGGHASTACLCIPITFILHFAVSYRSRFLVISWMILLLTMCVSRIILFIKYPAAFYILKWFEFYWICRVWFLTITFNYCLDLWSEYADAEHLDTPLLIPPGDERAWRGGHNYPDLPMTLDQRQKVYGWRRKTPLHLDWRYITTPLPTWFESQQDSSGATVLVIDSPAYDPDVR